MFMYACPPRQVEFYFSDANLRRDNFMRRKLEEPGENKHSGITTTITCLNE